MSTTAAREVAKQIQVERKIRVFYGTQTGTAEQFANELVQKLEALFDGVTVDCMVRLTRIIILKIICIALSNIGINRYSYLFAHPRTQRMRWPYICPEWM